jgi:serine phosphatase RsbU (regulator of sigma subunit)
MSADEYLFDDDDSSAESPSSAEVAEKKTWSVLIVDDDEQIHRVTKFALSNYTYDDQKITLEHAYSGKEAMAKLEDNEYATIFLDVVMESDHAGLEVVDYLRKVLENYRSRIILRTGQPGQAPEATVVKNYDIDDYRTKADLSVEKLYTSLTTSLRNYKERIKIENIVFERTQEVLEKNAQILESIRYAERIQQAVLPSIDHMRKFIPYLDVLYIPKDIVSGDFFFFSKFEKHLIFANVDCTGHGVPGAIMSIFAYNLLSLIVNFMGETSVELILQELDSKLAQLLNQQGKKDEINDGMDMSLIVIYPEKMELHFAGANHSLYQIRKGEIFAYEGDRNPIGAWIDSKKKFTTHVVQLQPDDRMYQFTDGITDQFGGPDGRKFSSKRLKTLLMEIQQMTVEEQVKELRKNFNDWKGGYNQTDDISLVAFEPKFTNIS